MRVVLASAPASPPAGSRERLDKQRWSKRRLLGLMQDSAAKVPQHRELLLGSWVKQHLRRSAGVPEDKALAVLEEITAPFVGGQGTPEDQRILQDVGDLLFHFDNSQLEVPGKKAAFGPQDLVAEALKQEKPFAVAMGIPDASIWNGMQWNFEWLITDFSKQQEDLYSPYHTLDGLEWQLSVEPKGNLGESLSVYLSANLSDEERQRVEYSITVVNQLDPRRNKRDGPEEHTFEGAQGWGNSSFMPLKKLMKKGWLVNDTLKIVASVKRLVG